MGGQATSNLLAPLLVARFPAWEQIGHVGYLTDPPIDEADGTDPLADAPRTHVWHSSKYRQDRRTCWVYIKTIDVGATYTLTVDSVAYVYDAGAGGANSAADILDGLHAVIVAAAPAAFSSNQVRSGDGSNDTTALRLESAPSGDSSAPSNIDIDAAPAATSGGVMQVFAETNSYDFDVWATGVRGRSDGPPEETHWFKLLERSASDLPEAEILNTAGMRRLAVVVKAHTMPVTDDGAVLPAFYIWVGPATDETVEADS